MNESINLKLQRALDCLDVRLEEELTRYRRQRAGLSVPSVVATPRKPAAKPLNLLALEASKPVSLPNSQPNQPHPISLESTSVGTAVDLPKAISHDQDIDQDVDVSPDVEDRLNELESNQLAIAPQDQDVENNTSFQKKYANFSEDQESAYITGHAESESGLLSAFDKTEEQPPEDYLESSEELLRSLAHEEAQVEVERSFLENLATPLGMGSLLMLLFSSAMFGYIIMNPSSLRGLTTVFSQPDRDAIEQSQASESSAGELPNAAALDAQEFVSLGLDNLTALKSAPARIQPSPIASPSPSPSPVAEPTAPTIKTPAAPTIANSVPKPVTTYTSTQSSNGSSESSRSASTSSYNSSSSSSGSSNSGGSSSSYSRRESYSAPAYNPPAPRSYSPPARSYLRSYDVPASSATRTANGGHSYKVEIPFTGDQSLADARKVAPDAFLRPDGKIQMGAARSASEAKAKVQKLESQGLSADVNRR